MTTVCACGCGQEIDNSKKKYQSRYVHGHNKSRLGTKNSEKSREAARQRWIGQTPWNAGKKGYHVHTDESKRILSENSKKMWARPEFREKMENLPSFEMPEEAKYKISRALQGHEVPPEVREKISESLKEYFNFKVIRAASRRRTD